MPMLAMGIDACRSGWVAVLWHEPGEAEAMLADRLADLVRRYPDAAAIGIDMPLGLTDHGWRQADQLAAARLGAHRSRVFLVPPRAVWGAATYQEALSACRALTDPPAGFSRQAWALKEKLGEANDLHDDGERRLFEVHPEISFAELNGGTPVAASKKSWNGQMTRRALLASAGIQLPADLGAAGLAGPDDVLDAAAAAWTAARIASRRAASLPAPPDTDAAGRPIAIWY